MSLCGLLRSGVCGVVIAIICCSCNINPNSVAVADVSRSGWVEQIDLVYDNQDTSALYDMGVVLRLSSGFQAKMLQLNMVIVTPDSLRYEERVALPVTVGQWHKEAESKEIVLPYRQNVHLARQGVYGVSITPEGSVVGVEAAGVIFEKR